MSDFVKKYISNLSPNNLCGILGYLSAKLFQYRKENVQLLPATQIYIDVDGVIRLSYAIGSNGFIYLNVHKYLHVKELIELIKYSHPNYYREAPKGSQEIGSISDFNYITVEYSLEYNELLIRLFNNWRTDIRPFNIAVSHQAIFNIVNLEGLIFFISDLLDKQIENSAIEQHKFLILDIMSDYFQNLVK